jgi:hypothetical protein
VYEGETFDESGIIVKLQKKITAIPPPALEHGQVPEFDRQKNALG